MNRLELEHLISSRFDGKQAQKHVEEITMHYRTAGSSGYHAAVEYAKSRLEEYGIHPQIETYPLDGKTELLSRQMAPAWEPVSGRVEIVSPLTELITTYDENPTCMMWWSSSTSANGVEAEVVDVGAGVDEKDYHNVNVDGKIVLAAGDGEQHSAARIYGLAVEKFHAIGILTDCLLYQHPEIRTRTGQPELVQLFRLEPKKNSSWGIALSYNQAEKIRNLLRNGRVSIRVKIETKMFDGVGENLVWEFGKKTADQQIVLISHISATKPAANCASGPAVMLEITRILTQLANENKIGSFTRKIKFLVGAEGFGVSAHFSKHQDEILNTLAALCLDSVGHNQAKCNSSIVLYRTPDSTASFINDLAAQIFTDLQKEGETPYKNTKDIPLPRFAELAYTPWSDNGALTALGISCPLIMSWPDTYFHTQALDAAKTDPNVFNFSGSAIATIVTMLTRKDDKTPQEITRIITARTHYRISNLIAQTAEADTLTDEIDYLIDHEKAAMKSVATLTSSRIEKSIKNLQLHLSNEGKLVKRTFTKPSRAKRTSEDRSPIPKRRKISIFPRFAGLNYVELKTLYGEMTKVDPSLKFYALVPISSEIGNLVNGRNSVKYITKAVSFQYHVKLEEKHVLHFLKSLKKLGHIEIT